MECNFRLRMVLGPSHKEVEIVQDRLSQNICSGDQLHHLLSCLSTLSRGNIASVGIFNIKLHAYFMAESSLPSSECVIQCVCCNNVFVELSPIKSTHAPFISRSFKQMFLCCTKSVFSYGIYTSVRVFCVNKPPLTLKKMTLNSD